MAVPAHDARLGEALKALGYPPSTVDKAREGYWSDFKTELATPKIDLVGMLERDKFDGYEDVVKQVVTGGFDG